MKKFLEGIGIVLVSILVLGIGFLIGSTIVFFIWNALIPVLFALPTITFGQSMLLVMLCNLLFKNPITYFTDK